MMFNKYQKNIGQLPAESMQAGSAIRLVDKLKGKLELDADFNTLASEWKTSLTGTSGSNQMQPNETDYHTLKYGIPFSEFESATNGSKYLYLLEMLVYKDLNNPHEWIVTETCNYIYFHQAWHNCEYHHNVVFTIKK